MTPQFVYINYSESEAFDDNSMYTFEQFERIAQVVATNHKTGGYLKTSVLVIMKGGKTYESRLDLNHIELGFQHHIKNCTDNFEIATNDPKIRSNEFYYNNLVEMNKFWVKMKFDEVA